MFFLVLCFNSCRRSSVDDFKSLDQDSTSISKIRENSKNAIIINVQDVSDIINASDLIEDVKYIPLETNDSSLIGYFRKILIYDNKIFIMDDMSAESVFIFDMNGNFITKIGTKGGAPNEFYKLAGMSIYKKKKELIVYDNKKKKMMYFTFNGKFIKSEKVNFRFYGSFAALPSGNIVSCTNKSCRNTHLGRWDDYRLVYTDSTGNINNVAFRYDDNEKLPMALSEIFDNGNSLLYQPCFKNELYEVTDSTFNFKYSIVLGSKFKSFNSKRLLSFKEINSFKQSWNNTTNLDNVAENDTHLYFSIANSNQKTFCFYDKRTKHVIVTNDMSFDSNWVINFPVIHAYKDYFIATVTPRLLKMVSDKSNSLSLDVQQLVKKKNDDDNSFLVMFKLKSF